MKNCSDSENQEKKIGPLTETEAHENNTAVPLKVSNFSRFRVCFLVVVFFSFPTTICADN